jgi:uncharacterized protein with PhoU and TrkA domain
MSLRLAVGTRNPLTLPAFNTRMLVTAVRRAPNGEPAVAVGLAVGGAPATEVVLRTGDTLVLHGRVSGARTLRATVVADAVLPLRLSEIID